MPITQPILISLLTLLTVLLIMTIWLYSRHRFTTSTLQKLTAALNNKETELMQSQQLIKELEVNLARVEVVKHSLEQRLQDTLQDQSEKQKQFEQMAQRILYQQSEQLKVKQEQSITALLHPLKEKINDFETKVQHTHIEAAKQHEALKVQLKALHDKSDQVSKDANNLAKALKGDFKQQGNWGELILESILEKSGLEKGREYTTQASYRDAESKLHRPDVIIHLPQDKEFVIDSKVSLVAYDKLVASTNLEDKQQWQQAHVLALKQHINQLSDKNYQLLLQGNSPDFVLMFIPIDTAFSAALEYADDLYAYAFDRNIVIVTPSTLLATLKTVESIWRNEKQQRYALDIADQAGKMYDKFVNFVEDMNKIGTQLTTVSSTYKTAMNKLKDGKGDLISRAAKIKELGARTSKQLKGE